MSTATELLYEESPGLHSYPPTAATTPFSQSKVSLALEDDHGHSNLPPVDRGFEAWKFVIAAFFLETFVWGYSFTFGIVQLYLSHHPTFRDNSLASIGAVGTLQMGFQYVLPIFITPYWRRYPEQAKLCLWVSLVVSPGAMIVSSWATQIWHLIILQGVLGGIANAFLYAPVLVWLAEWFVVKRGLASGIIFSGAGVGGFSFPFLVSACLNNLGYQWAFRIWGLITFVVYAACVLVVKPRVPVVKPITRVAWLPRDKTFFWNPRVLMMSGITLVGSAGFFPASLYLPTYVASLTGSSLKAEIVLAVFNAATVLSQVAVGYASDKFDAAFILAALGVCSSLTAFLAWGFADTLAKVFAFGIIFGSFAGLCSVWSAVARDVAGHDSYIATLLICEFEIPRGLAAMISSPIAAALYERHHSEEGAGWGAYGLRGVIVFAGAMSLASAVLSLGLRATKKKKLQ